jgi:Holliday junction resolvase
MGKASKDAGARFERWITDFLTKRGWSSARLRSFKVVGEPDLYATTNGYVFDIQAKERQNLNVHKIVDDLVNAQFQIALKNGGPVVAIPLVVYKRVERRGDTGKRMQVGPVIVALPLDDFVYIVEGANVPLVRGD